MIKLIDINKVPLRYLVEQFQNAPEELLYEICNFLQKSQSDTLEFNLAEVNNKTKVRILNTVEEDLNTLIELGYVEKLKYKKYKLLKSLWN